MTKASKAHERANLLAILFQALGEPIGLLLTTNNPHRARQRLYEARASATPEQREALAALQIRFSPFGDHQLVLTKGTPSDEQKIAAAAESATYLDL